MQRWVEGVRHAVKGQSWHAALVLALALPDVCGWVETPPTSTEDNRRARYVRWFDANVRALYTRRIGTDGEPRAVLDGETCYALRCAYAHPGDARTSEQADVLDRFRFVVAVKPPTVYPDPRLRFAARYNQLPLVDLAQLTVEADVLKRLPRAFCEKHQLIPIRYNAPTLLVAMVDPANLYALDEANLVTGCHIEPVVTSAASLAWALARFYDKGPELGTRTALGIAEHCSHVCTAVEAWRAKVTEPAMLERLAGLGRIDLL